MALCSAWVAGLGQRLLLRVVRREVRVCLYACAWLVELAWLHESALQLGWLCHALLLIDSCHSLLGGRGAVRHIARRLTKGWQRKGTSGKCPSRQMPTFTG